MRSRADLPLAFAAGARAGACGAANETRSSAHSLREACIPLTYDLLTEKLLRVRRSKAPDYLGISQRQLDYRIANKEIRTVRDGDAVFITMAELRRYAATNHPPIRNKARKEAE